MTSSTKRCVMPTSSKDSATERCVMLMKASPPSERSSSSRLENA